MLKADLHCHSTVSDGSDKVDTLIQKAIGFGLDVLAITDHDTMAHRRYIKENNSNLKVFCGIEISAFDPVTGCKAHVLGYGINDFETIESFTLPVLKARHENSLKQLEILSKNGFTIELDKVQRADDKYIYKQHIMDYLVKTEQSKDLLGDTYRRIFKNNGMCDFDIEYVNVFDAVEIIKFCGGFPVLAHPGQQKNYELIEKLIPLGLFGLECNHPYNMLKDRLIIKDIASKYRLYCTGGSDYHGDFGIEGTLGSELCESQEFINILLLK